MSFNHNHPCYFCIDNDATIKVDDNYYCQDCYDKEEEEQEESCRKYQQQQKQQQD